MSEHGRYDAVSRPGIVVTDEQQEQIRACLSAGQLEKAQSIILDIIAKADTEWQAYLMARGRVYTNNGEN